MRIRQIMDAVDARVRPEANPCPSRAEWEAIRALVEIDQIECVDRLEEPLANRDASLPSLRDMIEAMGEVGLVFAAGRQDDTIRRLDEMDS